MSPMPRQRKSADGTRPDSGSSRKYATTPSTSVRQPRRSNACARRPGGAPVATALRRSIRRASTAPATKAAMPRIVISKPSFVSSQSARPNSESRNGSTPGTWINDKPRK